MLVYILMTAVAVLIAQLAYGIYGPALYQIKRQVIFGNKGIYVNKGMFLCFLMILPSLFVAGFRYFVGTDYATYLSRENYIGKIFAGLPTRVEKGYEILIHIAHFFDNPQIVFFVNAAIFSVFIFLFIFRNSSDWRLSIVLLLLSGTFSNSLNIMRQMAAVAICLFAVRYIERKQPILFILYVTAAFFLHKLALLYLPFYFLQSFKVPKWTITIPALLALLALSPALRMLVYHIFTALGLVYAKYFNTIIDTGASFVLICENMGILLWCLLIRSRYGQGNMTPMLELMLWLQTAAIMILVLGLPNANRLTYMFMPVQIALIPDMASMLQKPYKWTLWAVMAGYILFFLYYYYYLGVGETFPYQSIFFQPELIFFSS